MSACSKAEEKTTAAVCDAYQGRRNEAADYIILWRASGSHIVVLSNYLCASMFNGKKIIVVLPAYKAARTLERTYKEIPFDIVDEVVLGHAQKV